jgi:hypothetical protein
VKDHSLSTFFVVAFLWAFFRRFRGQKGDPSLTFGGDCVLDSWLVLCRHLTGRLAYACTDTVVCRIVGIAFAPSFTHFLFPSRYPATKSFTA